MNGYDQQQQYARMLQHDLQRQGLDTKDLERVIGQMNSLKTAAAKGGWDTVVTQLADSVVTGLQVWEFELRKQLELGSTLRPVRGGTGDVPQDYRALVSEYYRSLAKKQ